MKNRNHHTSQRSSYFLLLVLLIGLTLAGTPDDVTAQAEDPEMEEQFYPILLYLDGSSLSTDPDGGGAQSESFGPSIISSAVIVGPWESEPMASTLTMNGSVMFRFYLSGTGRADFQYSLRVNDTEVFSDSFGYVFLQRDPVEYGMGAELDHIEVPQGGRLAILVQITYRGQGTAHWGSSDTPSHLEIVCRSINVGPVTIKNDPDRKRVRFNVTVGSAFGAEDIVNGYWAIGLPGNIDNVTVELKEEGPYEWAWVWEYGKDGAEPGEYMIMVLIEDKNGNVWYSLETFHIKETGSTQWLPDINYIIGIAVIGLVALLVTYKVFLEKRVKKAIHDLSTSTEYFGSFKRLVIAETLHDFSFNVLLMYSAFILAQSPNPEMGNLFVGINFALYQTVAVFFALGITKRSDTKKQRRNPLLLSIGLGGIILLVASGFTNVILFIIIFVIYMVAFYTKEMLEVALVTEYFPSKQRGKAYGLLVAVANIGGIVGGGLSGYLFDNFGMWLCLICGGAALLVSLVILWPIQDVGVKDAPAFSTWLKSCLSSIGSFGTWATQRIRGLSARAIDRFIFEFQNRRIMVLLFSTLVLVSIGSGMINPFVVVFLIDKGVTGTTIGLVYTLIGLAIFMPVNQLLTGWLIDRYTARKVFAGSVMVYIILWGTFNMAVAVKTHFLAILAIYSYPIWPFLYISSRLFASDMTPRSERARGITLTRFAMGIGFVIASVTGGLLLFYGINYETVFLLAMIFIFMAVATSLITMRASKGIPVIEED